MAIAPFGVLNEDQKLDLKDGKTLFAPMSDWQDGEAAYRTLLEEWLEDVKTSIWPAWEGGKWVGAAAKDMDQNTKAELLEAVSLYHGGGDQLGILEEYPDVPTPPDGKRRSQEWHYKIEDALVLDPKYFYWILANGDKPSYDFTASNNIGSNFIVYDPTFSIEQFENFFWGRMQEIEPSSIAIKCTCSGHVHGPQQLVWVSKVLDIPLQADPLQRIQECIHRY